MLEGARRARVLRPNEGQHRRRLSRAPGDQQLGTPLGHRKAQIEEIFQPLYFIRDFLTLVKNPELDDPQRRPMLDNLSAETQRLIDLLGRYFDQPTAGASSRAIPADEGKSP